VDFKNAYGAVPSVPGGQQLSLLYTSATITYTYLDSKVLFAIKLTMTLA